MTEPLYSPAPFGGTNDRMLAEYADALRGHIVAGFRILEATVEFDWLHQLGGDFIRVAVLVDDPPDGMHYWPREQLWELHATMSRMARRRCIAEHLSIQVHLMRDAAEAGVPVDVIARARAAAERPFEPERP